MEAQCKGGVRANGVKKTRLARGGIREYGAFLGHEMRGPAGTGRGGVLMAVGLEG